MSRRAFDPGGALSAAGLAQQAGKIGVINSQVVLEKSAEGKKVIAQLQDRDKKIQADLTQLDDEIKQLETKLSTQRLTLTEEAALQIRLGPREEEDRPEAAVRGRLREIQELQYRLFNKIQGELIPIIEELRQGKGDGRHLRPGQERRRLRQPGHRPDRRGHPALRRLQGRPGQVTGRADLDLDRTDPEAPAAPVSRSSWWTGCWSCVRRSPSSPSRT